MTLAFANPAYLWYEAVYRMLTPARATTRGMKLIFEDRCNPLAGTAYARTIAAGCQLFETAALRYDEPAFRLATTLLDGQQVDVNESVVRERLFGRVIAFDRKLGRPNPRPNPPFGQVIAFDQALHRAKPQPKLLMVAPLSGLFATLLLATTLEFGTTLIGAFGRQQCQPRDL